MKDSLHHASENDSLSKRPSQDVYQASSVAEIRAALAQLSERETAVTARLDSLVASQKDFSRELARLDLSRAQLGTQVLTARAVSNGVLADSASTARRISGAVKQLDLEQSRVKATLEVVEQVAELKACVLGVTTSMGASQDWERAAGYIHRASRIPQEIIQGQFAEEMVPTAEVPDPPSITLETASESLCRLFLREFEKAAKEGDGTRVTRFFKLFPLIDRSDVGLDVYGKYVCQGVASRTRANLNVGTGGNQSKDGFFYANALTKLFEHIAQIVDGHGGLVERHYGSGSMVRVIQRLQMEADMQGGLIVDTWTDERNVDRQLSDVKSYAFSFLVQSFLSQQRPSGTSRTGSHNANDSGAGMRTSHEEEGADMKEVDLLLSELTIMLGRWSLYCRFLAAKCRQSVSERPADEEGQPLYMPPILLESNLNRKINDRLISLFNTLTTFFFRRSVEKAFQLDEYPSDLSLNTQKSLPSNPPYITSAVDDVMYIVDKVLQRSLATSQRAVVSSVIPSVARVLSSDFIGMIQRKMRDECYPKAVIQGGFPPEDKIVAFLVLTNNLDLAAEYLGRVVRSRIQSEADITEGNREKSRSSSALEDLFPFDNDADFVSDSLKSLESVFRSKVTELLNDGIYVVFDRVIKPRLRPIIANAFRDVEYLVLDDGGGDYESRGHDHTDYPANDSTQSMHTDDDPLLVKRRFERSWDGLTVPIRRILTERNFDKLLSTTVAYLAKVLEKRIWSYHDRVNELGAVRLERDVANVVAAAVKGGKYGLRDAFLRCTQICLVLTMEEDEWDDQAADSQQGNGAEVPADVQLQWKLTRDERIRARSMLVRDG